MADSSPISGPSVLGHALSRHTQQRVRLPWRTLVGPVDARGLVTGPDGGGRGARASETWRQPRLCWTMHLVHSSATAKYHYCATVTGTRPSRMRRHRTHRKRHVTKWPRFPRRRTK